MKLTPQQLLELAKHQFELQHPVKALWQALADNFFPERADFTTVRNVGQEFADHLMDSYPLLIRRDLGNSLSAMLRDGDWFKIVTHGGQADYQGEAWLKWATETLYRLMYRREANFIRASKEGDHDFVTFGNCVKSVELNRRRSGLLFRTWHLRDCAWWEDETGHVSGVVRQANETKRDLVNYFGADALSKHMTKDLHKHPFSRHKIYHLCMPMEMYDDEGAANPRFPYISLYLDSENDHLIEEMPLTHCMYVVPRFQTIAGSAYAYSPATTVGLSDARCLQAMTHTLMEAAERYARPPLIATSQAVRSDIDLSSDGITWVDNEYDEKMGAALRPMVQDRGGWPVGDAERQRINETLISAFFLNKLTLPDVGHEMTAYEVAERMKQFRRENLPLFAPIEAEDNGQVCELAFDIAMQNGFLGSPQDIPPSLRGQETDFKFESPLSASQAEEQVNRFAQVREMLAGAIDLDPSIGHDIDLSTAIRDAVMGSGAPSTWLTDPEVAAERREAQAMMMAGKAAAEMAPDAAAAAVEQEVAA